MNNSFDTIVIGLGAMGSATIYQLAKRGIKSLGLDCFTPPHSFGSSHSESRITRQAIGEGEYFTPLSLRTMEIFQELEDTVNQKLIYLSGGLIIGKDNYRASINNVDNFFENTIKVANKYNIKYEVLSCKDITSKFSQFNVSPDEIGYYEYGSAALRPELIISAQLKLSQNLGAQLNLNEKFIGFEPHGNKVKVKTIDNSYAAEKLVITVGPWLGELLPQLNNYLKVYRQVLYWYDVSNSIDRFQIPNFPIFIWLPKNDSQMAMYGFPALDGVNGGIKIASEIYKETTTPEIVVRSVSDEEIISMYENKISHSFPLIKNNVLKTAVCLYTVTPNSNFIIDYLPDNNNVVICSACSGHGFKFSGAIGEQIVKFINNEKTLVDFSLFKLSQFNNLK